MHELIQTAIDSLTSPMVLFFVLGLAAASLRSDLAIPEPIGKGLSLYLMLAIGFRGGVELEHGHGQGAAIIWASLAAVSLSFVLPVLGYMLLRRVTKLDPTNAAAVAAHYGSVSVVTFAAAMTLLEQRGIPFEAYVVALLALMEAPAIVSGLFLSKQGRLDQPDSTLEPEGALPVREVFLSGSVVLLLGSFAIGWATGQKGMAELAPIVDAPFKGALCLFLLDMGLLTARRASELRGIGLRVAAFGLYMPLLGAAVGLLAAKMLGMSTGGATLFTVLAASASYIVVPAAMRNALPAANPALYLTLSLGITFPFNLIVGIPLYEAAAKVAIADDAQIAFNQEDTNESEEP